MKISRRKYLALAAGSIPMAAARRDESPERRIRKIIHEFEEQGFHRTATDVDLRSGKWLMAQVRDAGLRPSSETFSLSRVDPVATYAVIGGRRLEGLPLFDGSFTDAAGIRGRLGDLNSESPIGWVEIAPNAAAAGALLNARKNARHKAIVAVTRGRTPGLCPSNADHFLEPFGPPVLQVSSEDGAFLLEQAGKDTEAQVVAEVRRTPAEALNITARIEGSRKELPPLMIMTPRSGWWSCASERGGGLVCWLEVMRALRNSKPDRDIWFVASSGHEVGYLGMAAFINKRPGIAEHSRAWIHFGANIGAAQEPGNLVQASDDEMDQMLTRALESASMRVGRHAPRGNVPAGEAGLVHRGHGRYMSLIGGSALFHNQRDRGPDAVDIATLARIAGCFIAIARTLSSA